MLTTLGRRDVLLTIAVFSYIPTGVRADRAVSLGWAIINILSILIELTRNSRSRRFKLTGLAYIPD